MENAEKTILNIKRHSRYALLTLILKSCRQPKSKGDLYYTRPRMFHYTLLGKLLDQAVSLKLLEKQDDQFLTTRKGELFIKKFEELLRFLKTDG